MIPRLIYANTKNSDMWYLVGTVIPDEFFVLDIEAQKLIFLDKREMGAFEEHEGDRKRFAIIPLEPIIEEARKMATITDATLRVALTIMRTYAQGHTTIEVPSHFPLDLADGLRAHGMMLVVKKPFHPERAIKTVEEVAAIEGALKRTAVTFQLIEGMLRKSTIEGNRIVYNNNVLTSEFVKQSVEHTLLEHDMLNSEGLIISSGAQAAIPHHAGNGPLLAHQPIICDIFPKLRISGYFADMTRTYVKGMPTFEMRRIYDTVKEAQRAAIAAIKPGITGSIVHKISCNIFRDAGYDVGERGFVHGTGHGLGLDVHEFPFLSAANNEPLVPGNVVTVEPGLYYADRGSARIEDVVVVTEAGARNLTNYPKELCIP